MSENKAANQLIDYAAKNLVKNLLLKKLRQNLN